MDILYCCHSFQTSNSNTTTVISLLGVFVGLLTLSITLINKELTRKKELIEKLHTDIHTACDNILTTAHQVNTFGLASGYFGFLYLSVANHDEKNYYQNLCLKYMDAYLDSLKRNHVYNSELIKYSYLIKRYIDPQIAKRIITLIHLEDSTVPSGLKEYSNIFNGLSISDATALYQSELAKIQDYVYKESTGKYADEIRTLISGDV